MALSNNKGSEDTKKQMENFQQTLGQKAEDAEKALTQKTEQVKEEHPEAAKKAEGAAGFVKEKLSDAQYVVGDIYKHPEKIGQYSHQAVDAIARPFTHGATEVGKEGEAVGEKAKDQEGETEKEAVEKTSSTLGNIAHAGQAIVQKTAEFAHKGIDAVGSVLTRSAPAAGEQVEQEQMKAGGSEQATK